MSKFIKDLEYKQRNNITSETHKHYDIGYKTIDDEVCRVTSYSKATGIIFQTLEFKDTSKNKVIGEPEPRFLGQHKYSKGKTLVIAEESISALAIGQSNDTRWPCVSMGPIGSEKDVRDLFSCNSSYFSGFENIVLYLNNTANSRFIADVANEFIPYKVKSAVYPQQYTTPFNFFFAEGSKPVTQAYWQAAQVWDDCDDIIDMGEATVEDFKSEFSEGYLTGYSVIDEHVRGMRKAELHLYTAGSGMSKSTFAMEITSGLRSKYGHKIGNIFLEETQEKTLARYASIEHGVALADFREDNTRITDKQLQQTIDSFGKGNMFSVGHFGSMTCKTLVKKLDYLALAKGCDWIVLDHISIVTSGLSNENERKDIDILMTSLREFIARTGVGVIAIVHLSRPPKGDNFNEGRRISITDLKGSSSLEQLSDNIYAINGNQFSHAASMYRTIEVLKCRERGEAVGKTSHTVYDPSTGRITHSDTHPEIEPAFKPQGNSYFDASGGGNIIELDAKEKINF